MLKNVIFARIDTLVLLELFQKRKITKKSHFRLGDFSAH